MLSTIKEEKFGVFPITHSTVFGGQDYFHVSVDSERKIIFNRGSVKQLLGSLDIGYFIGASHGRNGDSGSPVFNLNGGLMGMVQGHRLSEVAEFQTDIRIVIVSYIAFTFFARYNSDGKYSDCGFTNQKPQANYINM